MEREYHLPVLGEKQYQNPFQYGSDTETHTNPDPYILKYEGKYYCYSSGEPGVNVSVSENLADWTYLGLAAKEAGKHEFWAPCVIYDNGTFYMYCANTPADTDDCHQEFLQLYTSTAPEGPFSYVKTFFQKFSIDAHVVKDVDGEVYLFYSVNDYMGTDEYHSGTVILVDRLVNYTELAGEEQIVVAPSIREEIFEENRFGDGRDWHTIEGAFFFRRHKKAYMMYAANAYVRENYFLGYSTADGTEKIADMSWRKFPDDDTFEPFIRRNEKVEGTGHNSVAKAPNMVDDWIVYHGRNQEQELIEGTEQREGRIDPLFYSGERLMSNAPSYLPQDLPEQPVYLTYDGTDSTSFKRYGSEGVPKWIYEGHLKDYIMEADVRCNLTHMGGRYGLLLSWTDERNYLELIIDSGKRCVLVSQVHNNICIQKAEARIPSDYRHDVTHNIKVLRTRSRFQVMLDEVQILEYESDIEYGQVGFITKYTDAEYRYFAVTEHVDLFAENLQFLPYYFESSVPGAFEDGKIVYHCNKEARLKELEEEPGCMKALEFELRSGRSKVWVKVMAQEECLADIRVEDGVISVVRNMEGQGEVSDTVSIEDKRFTVYVKQKEGRSAVFTEGMYVELKDDDRQQHLDISLFETDICSYSFTKLSK